jgi:hypothetical protein
MAPFGGITIGLSSKSRASSALSVIIMSSAPLALTWSGGHNIRNTRETRKKRKMQLKGLGSIYSPLPQLFSSDVRVGRPKST